MPDNTTHRKKKSKSPKNFIIFLIILVLFIGLPVIFLNYQARKSGMTMGQVLQRKMNKSSGQPEETITDLTGKKIDFLVPGPIGQPFTEPPQVSGLAVHDLDKDGLPDVIVCDTKSNFISWIRQGPAGVYTEKILAQDVLAPAHVQIIDFDKDGDNDIMLALLGMLYPSNDKIGSVMILENDGTCSFIKHTIVEKIARVSDVRAGDLDEDGDMDLAVVQFGYDDGETRWIENLGEWKFNNHILQNLSGPINIEIVDMDADGDLDLVSLVSQEWEEIYCFVNDGKGNFQLKMLWGSDNEDYGSSGIYISDLNLDGKPDILYTNGDAFDYIPPRGRPWHGVQWFENKGNLEFEFHRVCSFVGAFCARPADVDKDGDIDLFAVSAFNLWDNPESQSFIWMENTGNMQFMKRNIANAPTHLIALEPGDFNGDGNIDFVTGGMHVYPPNDRMGRVTLWINNDTLQFAKVNQP